MTTLHRIVALALAMTVLQPACRTPNAAKPSSPPAPDSEDLNPQIVSAIQRGRYADAVALAGQARVSKAESDFAVGEIILEGHTDGTASQAPRESIEEGLQRVEAAALAGHQQAISALAATFETGLSQRPTETLLLKPDAALSRCWEDAKSALQRASVCVDLRRKR